MYIINENPHHYNTHFFMYVSSAPYFSSGSLCRLKYYPWCSSFSFFPCSLTPCQKSLHSIDAPSIQLRLWHPAKGCLPHPHVDTALTHSGSISHTGRPCLVYWTSIPYQHFPPMWKPSSLPQALTCCFDHCGSFLLSAQSRKLLCLDLGLDGSGRERKR